ncbi:hypothetical protein ACLKA6_008325 [Drosophila palustris]
MRALVESARLRVTLVYNIKCLNYSNFLTNRRRTMSYPNHPVDTGGSNGPKQQSFNLSSSSNDSNPSNNGYNHNVNGDLDKSDVSQPLPAEQQNALANGGTSGSRKAKKHKSKKSKKRRDSKEVALVGWNGAFPNLSSTHSLESNSDVDLSDNKSRKKRRALPGDDIPTPPRVSSPPCEETSNASSRKRPPTAHQADSPIEPPEIDAKRSKQWQHEATVGRNNIRTRSKSLYQANPELVARSKRARSICGVAASSTAPPETGVAKLAPLKDRRRSGAGAGAGAGVKLPATDKFYCLPFKYGWKRELVLRSNSSLSRQRGDVIFISPGGKKLRSRDDIIPLLTGELTIDHFCFQRQMQQAGDEFESVRQAQPAQLRRQSLAAAKQLQQQQLQQQQQQLQQQQQQQPPNLQQQQPVQQQSQKRTPGSGKRVPKPKVPKGASPPPEGWTSTMAVKGNARVLAASNGNSGASTGSGAGGNNARKRSHQSKQSPKIQGAVPVAVPAAPLQVRTQPPPQSQLQLQPQSQLQPQPQPQIPSVVEQPLSSPQLPQQLGDNKMICVYCLQPIKERQKAYPVGMDNVKNYICSSCIKPTKKTIVPPRTPQSGAEANGANNQDREPIDENVNANANANTNTNANANANAGNNKFGYKEAVFEQNGDSNGSMLGIAEEIELPGALPPDQLLSDDTPISRAGNKITPKPQEIVVINGRKALAIAGEPPRPRLQVIPREPNLELYEKHYHPKRNSSAKEKRQGFVECMSAGNLSCQVMTAVMKTMDLHDRVRMSNVCKTWAMIGRDRSVWRTLKLRNTHINNWLSCMRDMVRYRTRELDMMGVKWQNPRLRMEGDMRVLRSLRILRTDACEAEFIHSIIKRLTRLLELRATCTSRVLNLANIEKMVDLQVLRIRMTEPKASIVSLQPLQKLEHLRELSLRGINNMAQLELSQLQGLKQLETLILGSCRGMKVAAFGDQVLPSLKRLRHLRLENHPSNRSFNITEIMKGIAVGAGTVKHLELINVNVDAEFSSQLAKCKSVEELLLMPNFHNNTANMMHYVMQAINENSEQLKVFRLGITFELLSVTRALMNNDKDCIPVALPIPGVPENDMLNESDEIAYLPVDRLESILHHMMPQAWLTVAKVSQSETTNLKFLLASPPIDSGGAPNPI